MEVMMKRVRGDWRVMVPKILRLTRRTPRKLKRVMRDDESSV